MAPQNLRSFILLFWPVNSEIARKLTISFHVEGAYRANYGFMSRILRNNKRQKQAILPQISNPL